MANNQATPACPSPDAAGHLSTMKYSDEVMDLLRDVHRTLDILFARLIIADKTFLPTKSGLPWATAIKVSLIVEEDQDDETKVH